jgi:hypothetical protein
MTYYDTLEEDLERARQILRNGTGHFGSFRPSGGTIIGADTYAAYKILESLIAEVERTRRALQTVMNCLGPEAPTDIDPGLNEEINTSLQACRDVGIKEIS